MIDRTRRRMLAVPLALAAMRVRADPIVYPDVRPGVPLRFPADCGAHPSYRSEWWYVTGWLRDDDGRELGFQLTFFRNRPGIGEASNSRFAPRQLLFAHAAIADPGEQRLLIDQRAAREGFGLAYAATDSTDVRIDDWSLMQQHDRYIAHVRAAAFALDIVLDARAPKLLQGNAGFSQKGIDPLDASFYYSEPQLAVSGSLSTGQRARNVTGIAWLDHEWSSRYLANGAVGWDWTGINLDDGGALMAFRIRDAQGNATWAGGAFRDANGTTRIFAPAAVGFSTQRRWRSPRTRFEYPVAVRVRAGDRDLVLEPLFDDQELDARAGVGVVYWEGAVRASVDGRPVGRGYLELTGYGGALRL